MAGFAVTTEARDAWCVGFTTRLLVVVWVGYDDNREIPPDGATSALRIFSAFMNRVSKLMNYGNAPDFVVPSGIVFSAVDRETRQRATGSCPAPSVEPFVAGTELVEVCHVHHGTVLPLTSFPNSRGTASTTNSRNLQ
jgi:penicillin-binding protein 1B